jgi:large subunit ribosomal protein L10
VVARPDKTQAVAEITERFNEADAVILTEYRGLRVGEIADVRGALRDSNTDYKVLKNTLTRIAVREVGLEELVGMLEGPTAIAFVKGDAVEAAKALDDASKKYPVLVIKGGVMQGKIIDAEQARQLAKLEPREVQLAKIVMMVNTPLQQTANVLSALLRDFGSMLAQVVAQKEAEAPAPEATPEPAGEAPAAEASPDAADATPESTDDSGDATPEAAEPAPEEAAPEAAAETEAAPETEATAEAPEAEAAVEAPEATEEEPKTEATEEEGKE